MEHGGITIPRGINVLEVTVNTLQLSAMSRKLTEIIDSLENDERPKEDIVSELEHVRGDVRKLLMA